MRIITSTLIFAAGWLALSMAWGQTVTKVNSCQADVFTPEALMQFPSVPSPNGRFRLVLGGFRDPANYRGGWLRIMEGAKIERQYGLQDLSAGIFVKWAPDSRAFYLMWSDGGQLGAYHLRVFQATDTGVREVRATSAAIAEFHRKHYCQAREDNIYAVRWVAGSAKLMIAAETYPTSDCGKDWSTIGYLVNIKDGQVVKRYSKHEVESEMKSCPSGFWPSAAWDQADVEKAKAALAEEEVPVK